MPDAEVFKAHLLEAGVMDPDLVHHEFKSGMHGQKLDFDIIESGSDLYKEWVDITAWEVKKRFPYQQNPPTILLGVANGTNRLALDAAYYVPNCIGFETLKTENKEIRITKTAKRAIEVLQPHITVVLEDVGTTGGSAVQVAQAARIAGTEDVHVLTTWKRRERLEKLEAAGIEYSAIIDEALTTYTPEECESSGFCSQGWEFIPRS